MKNLFILVGIFLSSNTFSLAFSKCSCTAKLLNNFGILAGCGDIMYSVKANFVLLNNDTLTNDTVTMIIPCPGDFPISSNCDPLFWKFGTIYKIEYKNIDNNDNYHVDKYDYKVVYYKELGEVVGAVPVK
jgi:hypothetical protein